MNENIKVQLKKYRTNIETGGIVLIMSGLWGLLKFLMSLAVGAQTLMSILDLSREEYEHLRFFILSFIFISFGAILFFHFIVGLSAIRYAHGKSSKTRFLIWTILLLVINFVCLPLYFYPTEDSVEDSTIVSFFVDLTLCICLFDLNASTIKLRKLLKNIERSGK
ncbi:hypothetical protein SAMN04487928_11429 [Butyrivibrio proteoclasticus]|uniref:Uncharacterized protein n=1 Tax=Butyrivibrio proteoclasticus TaxID=43305 RepID=A0A1I5USS0_9FIRM|nr:hypothetical protein [Butyrivibrio proteoclasticus]SFP98269.1 hypothetical protein SAMN04487928_11429 [Butyrivibrio proteoclasticus]